MNKEKKVLITPENVADVKKTLIQENIYNQFSPAYENTPTQENKLNEGVGDRLFTLLQMEQQVV